jgi:hypothetical protein
MLPCTSFCDRTTRWIRTSQVRTGASPAPAVQRTRFRRWVRATLGNASSEARGPATSHRGSYGDEELAGCGRRHHCNVGGEGSERVSGAVVAQTPRLDLCGGRSRPTLRHAGRDLPGGTPTATASDAAAAASRALVGAALAICATSQRTLRAARGKPPTVACMARLQVTASVRSDQIGARRSPVGQPASRTGTSRSAPGARQRREDRPQRR